MGMVADYGDEHIRTLDWKEHIRRRPGMYIGKLGDGTSADDGIYILIKEVLDNSVDEYMMGFGKSIDITIADDKTVLMNAYIHKSTEINYISHSSGHYHAGF